MTEGNKPDGWTVAQTLILTATAAGIFLTVGRRDREISFNSDHITELRLISTDLVKSKVLAEANDAKHFRAIADLRRRIERPEGG